MVNTIPSSHVYQGPSCHFFSAIRYIFTLGNFFFIYLPSARMQDHQRCVVAARLCGGVHCPVNWSLDVYSQSDGFLMIEPKK